ncbi:ABC transporter ATP-binding protein [Kurthia sp. 3B1D]|uniref:ABC transporter ATP-binding protein n=2 Tax=Kurthia TaxID=1649 RepID=A0A433RUK9_9BACL|nr:ABC transporter ATP-binding protein [Kurthia sp. 3B1D]RUS56976.1 ABC transporter ATP-binding protein [Kurthia sp. 3B1D]
MLRVEKLTKNYGKKQVLNSVDLTVYEGEVFGFLGRNGAGKSTFINILTGLAQPTSGSVTFFNNEQLSNDVKKRIGVLPDYSMFYNHLNAIEHLRYFAEISGKKVSKAEAQAILTKVGLKDDSRTKVGKYSFGMKKKLGFAQAVVHDPDFIFLDEPTSGVDAESAIVLQDFIRALQKQGKTIFLTSHNLSEIEKLCSRIAILKDGIITKIGTIHELKTNDTNEMHVRIKHGAISQNAKDAWFDQLSAFAPIVEHKPQFTTVQIHDEQQNAEILRCFHRFDIPVYRFDIEEKSLEEIFIDNKQVG